MAVYVDSMMMRADVPNGDKIVRGVWCHMVADTTEELVAMAKSIGMRTEWIQHAGTAGEHFDVTKSKRKLAVEAGAIEIDFNELAEFMRAKREFLKAQRASQ